MVHLQKSPPNLGWIGCVSQVINPTNLTSIHLFNFNEKWLSVDYSLVYKFIIRFFSYHYMLGTPELRCIYLLLLDFIWFSKGISSSSSFMGNKREQSFTSLKARHKGSIPQLNIYFLKVLGNYDLNGVIPPRNVPSRRLLQWRNSFSCLGGSLPYKK